MKLSTDELDDCWIKFKGGDLKAREQLILNYQTLVRIVANRVGMKLPAHVDREDLVSRRHDRLDDAMQKFISTADPFPTNTSSLASKT